MHHASPTARAVVVGLAAIAFAGCARDRRDASPQPAAAEPAVAAKPTTATMPPSAPVSADDALAGTVAETMNAAGYTYARLERGSGSVWVAGPETALAVGTKVSGGQGTLMTSFHSASLARTFDEIYFITAFAVEGGAPVSAAGAAPVGAGHGHGTSPLVEKVERAAGGSTIAEVFAARATKAGKPVVVRGKVVKVNNGILGKNWLHLQDGTGGAGTNDLLVTTAATAALGDVVVVRGTLATDRDFGSGYKYELLVEDATLAAK